MKRIWSEVGSRLACRFRMRLAASWMAVVVASLLVPFSQRAKAVGGLVDVSIVDRDAGSAMAMYSKDGAYYVAGRPGSKYSIRVVNRTGERVLAVMSVDGINVITGQSAGVQQSGYVIGPHQSQEITGWRKSNRQVAAFEFTSMPDSYAARTGRPDDVGVIGVAVFTEKREAVQVSPGQYGAGGRPLNESKESARAPAGASVGPMARDDRLGTGHGEIESSRATRTTFERSSAMPAEVVAVQYDSYEHLVRAGVIQVDATRPRPFPRSPAMSFVPDPPRR